MGCRMSKRKSALLVIDVQNDFLPPSGALAVPDGASVIPVINNLRNRVNFGIIVLTQDWHPNDHMSFHANNTENPNAKLLHPITLSNGCAQMMWPQHCVQNTPGAEFDKRLIIKTTDLFVQKGTDPLVDSYSGFFDNDHKTKSPLEGILKRAEITDVFITGLAYDYCVGYSALDANAAGFKTFVVEDATRGVASDSIKRMVTELQKAGVRIIRSADVPDSSLID